MGSNIRTRMLGTLSTLMLQPKTTDCTISSVYIKFEWPFRFKEPFSPSIWICYSNQSRQILASDAMSHAITISKWTLGYAFCIRHYALVSCSLRHRGGELILMLHYELHYECTMSCIISAYDFLLHKDSGQLSILFSFKNFVVPTWKFNHVYGTQKRIFSPRRFGRVQQRRKVIYCWIQLLYWLVIGWLPIQIVHSKWLFLLRWNWLFQGNGIWK